MTRSRRDDRGGILILTAILLPVVLLMTSFAIDLGQQRSARRTMQAKADVIALDLARLIDGGLATDIVYSPTLTAAAARNQVALAKINTPIWGTLNATTKKFEACASVDCRPTAVKVVAHDDDVDYLFHTGHGTVSRSAVGTIDRKAGFSIGSYAASLQSADGSSSILTSWLNTSLGLSVLSYQGLAATNLSFLAIANQMGLGTPTELFTTGVTARQFLLASAAVMRQSNPSSVDATLLQNAASLPAIGTMSLGSLLTVQSGAEQAALGGTFNVFDLLSGAALLANGNTGLAVPNVAVGIPGMTLAGQAHLTQAAQTVYGTIGDHADTSQLSLTMTSGVGTQSIANQSVSYLNGLFPALGLQGLLCGGLLGALLNLCLLGTKTVGLEITATANVSLAAARGTIADIKCPGTTKQLDIDVASELASTTVTFNVVVKIPGAPDKPLTFTATTGRPAATNGYADFVIPPQAFNVFEHAQPAVGGLSLQTTTIQTNALAGLGTLLTSTLNNAMATTINSLNTALITPLSSLVGIRVASADLAARSVTCNAVKLAG